MLKYICVGFKHSTVRKFYRYGTLVHTVHRNFQEQKYYVL
jgi:hypothetical protein